MSDLQKIKEQVSIRDVAESLLHLEKQDGKYKYPGERTASIQLYTDTQSFNDFGRNVGGDIFKLVSHIEGIDFKESLDEIVNFFQIRDVENKDEESSRPRWINYLEEKKKCQYIEHYNYSLISLKGEYLGYAFTKVRVMHQIKKKDDNGDEVLIWDKTLIYGTLNGDYIKCKVSELKSKLEELSKVRIETEEYKKIKDDIRALEDEFEKVETRQREWLDMGFSIDSAPLRELDKQMDDIWADIDRLQRKQKEMQTTGRAYVDPTSTDAYKSTAEKYNVESQKLENINGRLYSSSTAGRCLTR